MTAPLAEPIRLVVAEDGRLLSADAPIARLHHLAGGVDGGALALPTLADIARATARLRMRLSRPARIAAPDGDIMAWVDSRWEAANGAADNGGGRVHLDITGWREREGEAEPALDVAARAHDLAAFAEDGAVQVDAGLRIVAMRGSAAIGASDDGAATWIGRPVTEWAVLEAEPDGSLPLLAAVAERQPFASQIGRCGEDRVVSLAGRPLADRNGAFAGYLFAVTPVATTPLAAPPLMESMAFAGRLGPALRQPLGRIIANAETIGERLKGPLREGYAGYAHDIASAARHLLALVEDLGDLEVVERDGFGTAADDIDLADCARRVAGLLSVRAAEKQIAIIAPAEGMTLPATGEFRRVLQILVNLVGNAVRYSADGTEVVLSVERDGHQARVHVQDQGPGIAAPDQTRIFDKFERLGRSGDGGSGLGLYISRTLARAMDGDLSVASRLGEGARFTLELPARD